MEDGFKILGETEIEGSVCWGQKTTVTQDTIRQFTGNWSGTGDITGDAGEDNEKLAMNAGEYMESEMVHCGIGLVTLGVNQYDITGDAATISYKQGATPTACEADTWHVYSAPFECAGYCMIKVEPVVV
jgi:hypothetical protein